MTMTRDGVIERLHEILCEEFDLEPDQLEQDAHLYKDLGLDSLDAVDLIVALHRAFEVKVEEAEAREIGTVGELENYVCGKLEGLSSPS